MPSPLYTRGDAIVPHTGVDLSAAANLLLKATAGVPAVNDSATAPAVAVCLEGAEASGYSSLGILGSMSGTCRLKLGGAVTKYQRLQQVNDGRVEADAGSGSRVLIGIALEDGVEDQLIEVATFAPRLAS